MKELLEYMDSINADGIDFVSYGFPLDNIVYESYTRDEFEKNNAILKTRRIMWRIINGEKYYYCGENDSGYVIWKDIHSMKNDIRLDDIKTKISNIRDCM